ncbi:MAG TPA: hypothetical protein VGM18_05060 [Candidatus Sulfotelmatobacter sp.]
MQRSPVVAVLNLPVEDMRWCATCGREECFVAFLEGAAGRIGSCLGCGEISFVPFTRATTEVA